LRNAAQHWCGSRPALVDIANLRACVVGYSLNTLTLLAFAGRDWRTVDDAIRRD